MELNAVVMNCILIMLSDHVNNVKTLWIKEICDQVPCSMKNYNRSMVL